MLAQCVDFGHQAAILENMETKNLDKTSHLAVGTTIEKHERRLIGGVCVDEGGELVAGDAGQLLALLLRLLLLHDHDARRLLAVGCKSDDGGGGGRWMDE